MIASFKPQNFALHAMRLLGESFGCNCLIVRSERGGDVEQLEGEERLVMKVASVRQWEVRWSFPAPCLRHASEGRRAWRLMRLAPKMPK